MSDFDAVKGKVSLLNEKIETGYGVHSPLAVFAITPLCVGSPVWLSQEFQVLFDAVKGKVGLLGE